MNELIFEIETMVDKHGMSKILDALCQVCFLKADHLTVNWQDKKSARPWESAAHKLSTLAGSSYLKEVS